MMEKRKTIGVLTSGGDAPGMNPAIRAVVRAALSKGHRVLGIHRGYRGLLENDYVEMQMRSVSDVIQRGGTVLYTARCEEFKTPEGLNLALENGRKMGLDGLVVIGGDGSYRGACALSNAGIPCVGIPGTIDNDIASTDYSIGFDTCINTVVESVDKLRDTAQSHARCSVVEVMGRRAGHIALYAGIACGATAILIPERPYDLQRDVIDRMKETLRDGKSHFIIIVAEGAGDSREISQKIETAIQIDTRLTVLGHVQRGGSPSARERVNASMMGYRAVELLEEGKGNRVIGMQNGQIVDYEINEALAMKKDIDERLYKIAYDISI